MNKATLKYIQDNQYIYEIEREKVISEKQKKINFDHTIKALVWKNFKNILSAIKNYPLEIIKGYQYFNKTKNLKKKKGKKALVIGNGPSQGTLKYKDLTQFKENGGEIFCVNYWTENEELYKHVPDWILISDPNIFNEENRSNVIRMKKFINYLENNKNIKLIMPVTLINKFPNNLLNEIYAFSDVELNMWRNINPLLPRGYLSMTLYKALAFAIYLEFDTIAVIGMDNTYPRNIYNDFDNKVCNLETHAGREDTLLDMSDLFPTVASLLSEHTRLFYHLEYFPKYNIYNLDKFSLTDRFNKITKKEFFESK
jgi:hypothetical protein